MTRKHFELLAKIQREARAVAKDHPVVGHRSAQVAMVDHISRQQAMYLKADNPRFDGAKYLAACGAIA